MDIYTLVWCFFIYAFLGWCLEVAYAAFKTRKFVNRGFLNGPVCPIYGFGVVIVLLSVEKYTDNIVMLFIASTIVTSLLELATGWALEKIFHQKWWDYSEVPLNIGGYICLSFSLIWGIICVFVVKVVQPVILLFIHIIPQLMGNILLTIFVILFIVDVSVTIATILKIRKRSKSLDELALKIKEVSNEIGQKIYQDVVELIDKNTEFQREHETDIAKLAQNFEKLKQEKILGEKRLQQAFPNIRKVIQREKAKKEQ